jgi:hypothetical protein
MVHMVYIRQYRERHERRAHKLAGREREGRKRRGKGRSEGGAAMSHRAILNLNSTRIFDGRVL